MKHFSLLVAPLLLCACVPDVFSTKPDVNIHTESTEGITLTKTNPSIGETMNIAKNVTLVIRLDANPTTGIWWQDPEFDATVLELVSNEYIADPAPAGIAGSGGTTVMTFKSIAPGTTDITSEYSRGGEVYEKLQMTVVVAK